MPWTYNQTNRQMLDDSGELRATPYSGQPPHTNVPDDQWIVDKGVIPCGLWKAVSVITRDPKLGYFVIVLAPADDETRTNVEAMGRNADSFRWHGERIAPPPGYASDGCLVDGVAQRQNFWYTSVDRLIQVIKGEPPNAQPKPITAE